jgi:hypothetical protein
VMSDFHWLIEKVLPSGNLGQEYWDGEGFTVDPWKAYSFQDKDSAECKVVAAGLRDVRPVEHGFYYEES